MISFHKPPHPSKNVTFSPSIIKLLVSIETKLKKRTKIVNQKKLENAL
jgi:hypothetical protein